MLVRFWGNLEIVFFNVSHDLLTFSGYVNIITDFFVPEIERQEIRIGHVWF